jgi:hypothetical protein
LYQVKGALQPIAAVRGLLRFRRSVAWGPTSENVANVHVIAFHPRRTDDAIEELSGSADEGLALQIFVAAGSFSDETYVRPNGPNAKDGLRACRGEFLAAYASGDLPGEGFQCNPTLVDSISNAASVRQGRSRK